MTRETDTLLLLRRVRARCESLPPAAIGGRAAVGCMSMPRQPACLYGARNMPPRQACSCEVSLHDP